MVINDNVSSHNLTNVCTLILKQPLMSIMDQIDPPTPWQTVNIFVLFNAFETFCFPQCITEMPRVYFSSVNVVMHIYPFCCQEWAYASGRVKYAFYDRSNCKGTIVIGK